MPRLLQSCEHLASTQPGGLSSAPIRCRMQLQLTAAQMHALRTHRPSLETMRRRTWGRTTSSPSQWSPFPYALLSVFGSMLGSLGLGGSSHARAARSMPNCRADAARPFDVHMLIPPLRRNRPQLRSTVTPPSRGGIDLRQRITHATELDRMGDVQGPR